MVEDRTQEKPILRIMSWSTIRENKKSGVIEDLGNSIITYTPLSGGKGKVISIDQFNGESEGVIYSDRRLRIELKDNGMEFIAFSDFTE